jgi:hypothetical protein
MENPRLSARGVRFFLVLFVNLCAFSLYTLNRNYEGDRRSDEMTRDAARERPTLNRTEIARNLITMTAAAIQNGLSATATPLPPIFQRIATHNAGGQVQHLQLSADGSHLLILAEGQLTLWDIGAQSAPQIIETAAVSASLSPDEDLVAFGHSDGGVYLWNAADAAANRLGEHKDAVRAFAFSPDSVWLASADQDVQIWDLATGEPVHSYEDYPGDINSMVFDVNSASLIIGGSSPEVFFWRLGAETARDYAGHESEITVLALSAQGRVASGDAAGAVRLWNPDNVAAGSLLIGEQSGEVHGLAFSDDGTVLIVLGQQISRWGVAERRQWDVIALSQTPPTHLILHGDRIITADDDGQVVIWQQQ